MNVGDSLTVPSGKEKDPSHKGVSFTVDKIDGEAVALRLPDGSVYNGYTKADLVIMPDPGPPKPFAEPKVLEAVVDPKKKQEETPVPFSFTSPQAMHAKAALPTKGDAAKLEETAKPKLTLEQLDAEIAADQKAGKEPTIDDYRDTAEMFIEGWEAILTFAARMISKDTSDTAYEFSVTKKERLIHQATKVSRKRNWVMPIEYLFLGTLLPATGTILLKASDKRKEYFAALEKDKPAGSSETEKKPLRRRGPGRPHKG